MRPTLGWLRVLLALMVLDLHYGFYRKLVAPHLPSGLGPLAWLNDGAIAVFGFFLLSGYLVADMLERRQPMRSAADLGRFLLGRLARIYPLYWLALGVWLTVRPGPPPGFWAVVGNVLLFPYGLWSFFFDHARYGPLFSQFLLVPAWTLALDLVFYPIGALLMAARPLLPLWLAICTAFAVIAAAEAPTGIGMAGYDYWHMQFWTSAEPNLLAFLLGIGAYRWARTLPRPPALAAGALLILGWVAYLPWGLGYFGAYFLSLAAMTLLVHHLGGAGRGRHEALLGNFTYALYLVHIPVLFLLGQRYGWAFGVRALGALASVAVAGLLAVAVEAPLERVRHTWLRHPTGTTQRFPFALLASGGAAICLSSAVWYALLGGGTAGALPFTVSERVDPCLRHYRLLATAPCPNSRITMCAWPTAG